MKRVYGVLAMAAVMLASPGEALSQGSASKELDELRARIEALENRLKEEEVVDELGHKYHPIHSIYGLKIGGGVTIVGQGVTNIKAAKRGQLSLSGDIYLESPVGDSGKLFAIFDLQRGTGPRNLPALFTGPNGSPTGPNGDLESFDNDQAHLTQFYYEHEVDKTLVISVGQMDPTAFFDTNAFANSERTQYLANVFINSPTIEFGGSGDFYGPGIRATWWPTENFDISVGAFEGNGDYIDSFDNPFLMAEANLKINLADKEGNYRVYYWNRQGRPDVANTANPNDTTLLEEDNSGFGVSFDQALTDNLGLWLRAGVQREKVAQFDKSVSAGVLASGLFGRENDTIGFGYAVTFMGKDYEDFQKSQNAAFRAGDEHYMELFYNWAVGSAGEYHGLHISPDLQYIVNAGGDKDATSFFVYGLRMQAFF